MEEDYTYGVGITNRFEYFNDEGIGEAEIRVAAPQPVKKKQVTPDKSTKQQPAPEKLTVKPQVKVIVKTKAPTNPTSSVGDGSNTAENSKQELVSEKKSWSVTDRSTQKTSGPTKLFPAGGDFNGEGVATVARQMSRTRIVSRGGNGGITSRRPNRGQYSQRQHHHTEVPLENKDKGDEQAKSLEKKSADSATDDTDGKETHPEEIKDADKEESKENEKQKGNGSQAQCPKTDTPEPAVTFTLSQWKASQVPHEKPTFNIRKPGEGEKKLEKLVPLKKEDKLVLPETDESEVDEVYYPQRAGKQKHISDVGFTFDSGRGRRRSSRSGGRDGPRSSFGQNINQVTKTKQPPRTKGHYHRGGGTGSESLVKVQVPRIDDNADFPTLG